YAVTAQHPGLPGLLRSAGIEAVVVCGIATNICCFYAARDLRQAGFRVLLVEDASAGIDVPAANLHQDQAKAEGQQAGIEYVTTADILASVEAPWAVALRHPLFGQALPGTGEHLSVIEG